MWCRKVLRILICDDDASYLEDLNSEVLLFFSEYGQKVKTYTFLNLDQINQKLLGSCDIALLDVDFPNSGHTGLDVARKIRELRKDTIIIFVTNFIEYAPVGYEVQAFRYVLKQETRSELPRYLALAVKRISKISGVYKIQMNGEYADLVVDDILYLEVQQHNVTFFVQREGKPIKTYCVYSSLSEMERDLGPKGFLRIHKSYLVNMRHLKLFQCRRALLYNGIELRVSEKSYAEQKKKFLLWKGIC